MAVTEEAIDKIKQMIVSGELNPGDRLPVERELALRLGLSRNSLREAVRALSILGILTVRQGDGTYVSDLEPGALLSGLGFFLEVGPDARALEALEARRVLEPVLTRLAALNITAEKLEELRREMARMENAASVQELIDADVEFHRVVTEGSGNALLAGFLNELGRTTVRGRMWRIIQQQRANDSPIYEHRTILRAVSERDPDLAFAASAIHVANTERWFRETIAASTGDNHADSAEIESFPHAAGDRPDGAVSG